MITGWKFICSALPWIAAGVSLAVVLEKRTTQKRRGNGKYGDYGEEGMCIGMCVGCALGSALNGNAGLGLSIGMLIGLVTGMCIPKRK